MSPISHPADVKFRQTASGGSPRGFWRLVGERRAHTHRTNEDNAVIAAKEANPMKRLINRLSSPTPSTYGLMFVPSWTGLPSTPDAMARRVAELNEPSELDPTPRGGVRPIAAAPIVPATAQPALA